MRKEQQNYSQKFATEKKKSTEQSQRFQTPQHLDEHYSKSINFLVQPNFLKLRNLTNLQQNSRISSQHQIESLLRKINELETKVQVLERRIRYKKKKRIRRTSQQIVKMHTCKVCNKKYGSLVSLNLHLRLKHSIQTSEDNINRNDSQEKQQERVEQ